jgi:hypothetical protein
MSHYKPYQASADFVANYQLVKIRQEVCLLTVTKTVIEIVKEVMHNYNFLDNGSH